MHGTNHSFWVLMPVLLTLIISEFSISVTEAGLLVTVFFVTYALFQLPVGSLADRVDKRLLIGLGMGISSAGVILSGLATSFPMLLLFHAIAGLGGGTFHPASISLLSEAFHKAERGRALGFHGFAASIALFVSPLAIIGLGETDWRAPFLVFGTFGILVSIFFIALIGKQLSGISQPIRYSTLMLRNKNLRNVTVGNAVLALAERGVITFIPLFLVSLYAMTISQATQMFSVIFLVAIGGQLFGGFLADKANRRILVIILAIIQTVALLVLASVPFEMLLIPVLAIIGLTVYALIPVVDTLVVEAVPEESRGKGLGAFFTVGIAVGALSPTISARIIENLGFQTAYIALALLPVISIPLLINARLSDRK